MVFMFSRVTLPNVLTLDGCNDEQCPVVPRNSSFPTYAAYEFCSRSYGASLVLLFVISTLFHWISWTQSHWKKRSHAGCCVRRPSLNKFFHICDRTTIYFFIAGSYSPWLMLHETHQSIMWLQWAIWLAAVLGTMYTFIFLEKFKLLETLFYLFVGIVPGVLALMYNPSHSTSSGFTELALGGTFYIFGVLVFKCDGIIPFAHAIWHTFVTAGAISHYYGIYKHFYSS
ncbi:unnamed protein product [Clavelina lepadiformis]|uniref:Uncharacterized protein n=1 Tax=Clavelina lepadiformis TaxID=159417 RepID=A0ABP0FQ75_CLALP